MIAIGLVGFALAGDDKEETLDSLCKSVGTQATAELRAANYRKIADRLDRMIEPILRAHTYPNEIAAAITAASGGEGENHSCVEILFKSVPGGSDTVIAYSIPMIPAGNTSTVVLRLFSSAGPDGAGSALRPLDDPEGRFANVESCRAEEIRFVRRNDGWDVVLLVANHNGHGLYGLSDWSLSERKCRWSESFEYGDAACFYVTHGNLFARIAHGDLDNDEKHPCVSEEGFGPTVEAFPSLWNCYENRLPECGLKP